MERTTLKGVSAETVMRTDPSSAVSVVAVTPLGPVYNKLIEFWLETLE